MAYNGLSDALLGEIQKRNRKTVSTIENNQKKIRAQQGSGGSGNSGGGSGNGYKMSADTYKRYEADYATWQKTGKHSTGFNSWGNQKDLDIWKQIRNGKYQSAQVGNDIYYLDNNQYRQYGKDYDTWTKTGSHSKDYDTWGTSDGANAFRYIHDDKNGYGALNNLKVSLDDELTKAVAEKYKSQWGDKYYYDMSDPDDIAAMATGGMPAYLRKKYKTSNPIDQYLLEQGLPYASLFNDMYSEAWQDRNERNAKKQSIYDSAFADVQGYRKNMYDLREEMYGGADFADALATGKYDALGDFYDATFGKVNENDPEGKKYFSTKKAELDPVYDRAYEAMARGELPDDEFFDQYKDSTWKSFLKQKQKWNESSFQDVYDYKAVQEAQAFLNDDPYHRDTFDYNSLIPGTKGEYKEAGYKVSDDFVMLKPIVFTSKDGKKSIVVNPRMQDGSFIPKDQLEDYAKDYFGESGILWGAFNQGNEDPNGIVIAEFDSKKDADSYAKRLESSVKTLYGTESEDFEKNYQEFQKQREEKTEEFLSDLSERVSSGEATAGSLVAAALTYTPETDPWNIAIRTGDLDALTALMNGDREGAQRVLNEQIVENETDDMQGLYQVRREIQLEGNLSSQRRSKKDEERLETDLQKYGISRYDSNGNKKNKKQLLEEIDAALDARERAGLDAWEASEWERYLGMDTSGKVKTAKEIQEDRRMLEQTRSRQKMIDEQLQFIDNLTRTGDYGQIQAIVQNAGYNSPDEWIEALQREQQINAEKIRQLSGADETKDNEMALAVQTVQKYLDSGVRSDQAIPSDQLQGKTAYEKYQDTKQVNELIPFVSDLIRVHDASYANEVARNAGFNSAEEWLAALQNEKAQIEAGQTPGISTENRYYYMAMTGQLTDRDKIGLSHGAYNVEDMENIASQIRPEELATLNGMIASGASADDINQFIESLITIGQWRLTKADKYAEARAEAENPLVGVAHQLTGSIESSVQYPAGLAAKAIMGDEYDPMQMEFEQKGARRSADVAEARSERLGYNYQDEITILGKKFTAGQLASFLADTGVSMLDSATRMMLGGGSVIGEAVTLGMGGLSAGSQTLIDGIDSNRPVKEAMVLACVAAGAEVITEKISLEHFFALAKGSSPATFKQILVEMAKQGFTEGSEEVEADIINMIAEAVLTGDVDELQESTLAIMQRHPGMNENTAFGIAIGEKLGLSFAGGALSGIGFGAAGSGGAVINGDVQSTIDMAIEFGNQALRTESLNRMGLDAESVLQIEQSIISCGMSQDMVDKATEVLDTIRTNARALDSEEGRQLVQEFKDYFDTQVQEYEAYQAKNNVRQEKRAAQKAKDNRFMSKLFGELSSAQQAAHEAIEARDAIRAEKIQNDEKTHIKKIQEEQARQEEQNRIAEAEEQQHQLEEAQHIERTNKKANAFLEKTLEAMDKQTANAEAQAVEQAVIEDKANADADVIAQAIAQPDETQQIREGEQEVTQAPLDENVSPEEQLYDVLLATQDEQEGQKEAPEVSESEKSQLADEFVRMSTEYDQALANNDQQGQQKVLNDMEQLRQTYGDNVVRPIVESIINGGTNGTEELNGPDGGTEQVYFDAVNGTANGTAEANDIPALRREGEPVSFDQRNAPAGLQGQPGDRSEVQRTVREFAEAAQQRADSEGAGRSLGRIHDWDNKSNGELNRATADANREISAAGRSERLQPGDLRGRSANDVGQATRDNIAAAEALSGIDETSLYDVLRYLAGLSLDGITPADKSGSFVRFMNGDIMEIFAKLHEDAHRVKEFRDAVDQIMMGLSEDERNRIYRGYAMARGMNAKGLTYDGSTKLAEEFQCDVVGAYGLFKITNSSAGWIRIFFGNANDLTETDLKNLAKTSSLFAPVGNVLNGTARNADGTVNEETKFLVGGRGAKNIPEGTEFFKGVDGKERFHIYDGSAAFNKDAFKDGKARLKDVLNHDTLYDYYSGLENVPVIISNKLGETKARLERRGGEYRILLNDKYSQSDGNYDDIVGSLLHEAQHWIQFAEGFATGGNKKNISAIFISDAIKYCQDNNRFNKDLWHDINEVYKAYKELNGDKNADKLYQSLVGEQEARAPGKAYKARMSPEEAAEQIRQLHGEMVNDPVSIESEFEDADDVIKAFLKNRGINLANFLGHNYDNNVHDDYRKGAAWFDEKLRGVYLQALSEDSTQDFDVVSGSTSGQVDLSESLVHGLRLNNDLQSDIEAPSGAFSMPENRTMMDEVLNPVNETPQEEETGGTKFSFAPQGGLTSEQRNELYNDRSSAERSVKELQDEGFHYFRRNNNPDSPSNDVDFLMFVADDGPSADSVLDGQYGDYLWMANDSNAIDVDDIADEIKNAWADFAEQNGYETELTDDEITPPDIVDTAGVWDNADFLQYLFENDVLGKYVGDDGLAIKVGSGLMVFPKYDGTFSDNVQPAYNGETDLAKREQNGIKGRSPSMSQSDTEYLSAVERGDTETAQRMVDEAANSIFADSKIRDEEGKLIKVYHGTDAEFTVFDSTKGRSTMDIQGMFFSPWEIDAGGYGPNVGEYYLDIKNPVPEGVAYRALNKFKGQNNAGVLARKYLESLGYDGVNNSDEEYIAFYPEQIKSADAVTYDDSGEMIPLSQRFNAKESDTRFSIAPPIGLTKEQRKQMYQWNREQLDKQYQRMSTEQRASVIRERQRMETQQSAQKSRADIVHTANDLASWLKNPNVKEGKYIPDFLKDSILSALQGIDIGSASGEGGQIAQNWRQNMQNLANNLAQYQMHKNGDNADARFNGVYLELPDGFVEMFQDLANSIGEDGTNYLQDMRPSKEDVDRRVRSIADRDGISFAQANARYRSDVWNDLRLESAERLTQLSDSLKILKKAVTDANKLHANGRTQSVAELGMETVHELDQKKAKKQKSGIAKFIDDLINVEMLDAPSFAQRLGNAGGSVINGIINGFLKGTTHVKEAQEFFESARKDEKVSKRDIHNWSNKGVTLTLESGKTIGMTEGQLMNLYALSKRPQALQHILSGGIEIGYNKASKNSQNRAYKLTYADLDNAFAKLSDKQKSFVDRLQTYLSTTASSWGNEVSQTLYGIDMYGEENYWPIRSAKSGLATQDPEKVRAFNALMNASFTKLTNRYASNPIMLDDAIQVFCDHVSQMSNYNGMAIPIADAMKWFNFQNRGADGTIDWNSSVKRSVTETMGNGGTKYFVNLIKDINGLSEGGTGTELPSKIVSNTKRAAVAGKLRVMIQQPTAVVRAMSMINPVYFVGMNDIQLGKVVKEMQENAPIAWWKSQGNFDIGTGKSMRDIISGDTSALEGVMNATMAPAGLADDLGWSWIWNAVKREQAARNPGLKGQELKDKVVERFTDVINKTQVIDTVVHRSQIMRSKDNMVKQATAFMSEPIKTFNLLHNAINDVADGKPGAKARFAKTLIGVAASWAVNAAVLALHDSLRDRDDDDDLWEMIKENWLDEFKSNADPIQSIPYLRDVESLLKGSDVERMDLSSLSDLVTSAQRLYKAITTGESQYTQYGLYRGLVTAAGNVLGTPLTGLLNSAEVAINAAAPGTLLRRKTKGWDKAEGLIEEGIDKKQARGLMKNYKSDNTATKAFSILTYDGDKDGEPDFDEEEQNLIAAVLGLSYDPEKDGTLTDYAVNAANKYLSGKQKIMEKDDTTDEEYMKASEAYDKYSELYDDYFEFLGLN